MTTAMQRPTSIKLQRLTQPTPEATAMAEEYAPYNSMLAFWLGFSDYHQSYGYRSLDGVEAQAYDRGMELAMRAARQSPT